MSDVNQAVVHLRSGAWEAAHEIVQNDESPLGAWAHGIVHVLEGDLANASYWFRRAGRELPPPGGIAGEIEALAKAVCD